MRNLGSGRIGRGGLDGADWMGRGIGAERKGLEGKGLGEEGWKGKGFQVC